MVADKSTTTTPPLENGDRLTRIEFERRYAAMPHLKKAELIEAVVYVPAVLRFRNHGQPHANLIGWLKIIVVIIERVAKTRPCISGLTRSIQIVSVELPTTGRLKQQANSAEIQTKGTLSKPKIILLKPIPSIPNRIPLIRR